MQHNVVAPGKTIRDVDFSRCASQRVLSDRRRQAVFMAFLRGPSWENGFFPQLCKKMTDKLAIAEFRK
jgi:hypothetical protein